MPSPIFCSSPPLFLHTLWDPHSTVCKVTHVLSFLTEHSPPLAVLHITHLCEHTHTYTSSHTRTNIRGILLTPPILFLDSLVLLFFFLDSLVLKAPTSHLSEVTHSRSSGSDTGFILLSKILKNNTPSPLPPPPTLFQKRKHFYFQRKQEGSYLGIKDIPLSQII